MPRKARSRPAEIAVVGEVDDWEEDVIKAILEVPAGGECVFYIDSAGGSVYGALAVLALLRHRELSATAVVLGECSSATLLVFAGCKKRVVTRFSAFLFHRMHWESEKRVNSTEALSWAQHFDQIEKDMDDLLVRLLGTSVERVRGWTSSERYVMGPELVEAGLAELMEVE
jgi:ATP-dependent Clp protease, protease subunit